MTFPSRIFIEYLFAVENAVCDRKDNRAGAPNQPSPSDLNYNTHIRNVLSHKVSFKLFHLYLYSCKIDWSQMRYETSLGQCSSIQ